MMGLNYAHPRNTFRRLIGHVIGQDLQPLEYQDRLDALLAAGVGLWDTVASASREGSLDSALRDSRPNALAEFVGTLPQLRAVGFNGAASARAGMAQLGHSDIALLKLPSSSPAYAAMPLAAKEERWAALQEFLR